MQGPRFRVRGSPIRFSSYSLYIHNGSCFKLQAGHMVQ